MNCWNRIAVLAVCTVAAAIGMSAQDTTAADEMHAGIVAYKFSDYAGAAQHFRNALDLNPLLPQARLYLATSYAQQYVPGDESEANVGMAEQAIAEFKKVLSSDPGESDRYKCVVPIASLNFNLKRFDVSREYYEKAIELNSSDAHNYFMIGLMDWTEAHADRVKAQSAAGLTESEMLGSGGACTALKEKNGARVEGGILRLQKVLELQPNNGDAMGYMNMLYRERAEYECDDPDARKADLKTADEWVDKAIAVKKAEQEPAPPSAQ